MPTKRGIQKPGIVGYIRVWTDRQGPSEPTYNTQRAAILAESRRRELPILYFFVDQAPYGQRPADPYNLSLADYGLRSALAALGEGRGSVLAVTEFERLGDHPETAVRWAESQGWELLALDRAEKPPSAEVVPWRNLSAEEKRQRISNRTTEALAHKKLQGVRLGRPRSLPVGVLEYVLEAHAAGLGWSAIARIMNERHVPTAHGGRRWYPSTVRAVVLGQRIR
jgi:DNA invertase Pin-like site-specific DNA recombinase